MSGLTLVAVFASLFTTDPHAAGSAHESAERKQVSALAACDRLEAVSSLERGPHKERRFERYVLDPDLINRLSCRARVRLESALAQGVAEMLAQKQAVHSFVSELEHHYPGYVATDDEWMANIAGGALFQISVRVCNTDEYLLIFSSPTGTEGYSGRYEMELWDFVLRGEIRDYTIGSLESQAWGPGRYTYMRPGDAQGFRAAAGTLVVEYARGKVGSAVQFGISANKRNLGRVESREQIRRCRKLYFSTRKARRELRKRKKAGLLAGPRPGKPVAHK